MPAGLLADTFHGGSVTVPGDTAAPAKQGGLFEDLIEVFYAPSTVFDRTRNATVGKYLLVTAVIVAVILVATKGLMMPYFDAQFDLTAKMSAAKGRPMPEAARAATTYSIMGASILFAALGPFVNGFFLTLGSKIIGVPLSFARASVIAVLAGMPRIVSWLSVAVQGLLLDDASSVRSLSDASIGPARLVDPETTSPAILALLGGFDLFRIWQIVLMGIGISVVARVSRTNGYLAAVIAMGIVTVISLIPSALFG